MAGLHDNDDDSDMMSTIMMMIMMMMIVPIILIYLPYAEDRVTMSYISSFNLYNIIMKMLRVYLLYK